MDENDFSEDTTYKQQEDLPYDGDLSQMNICNDYNFTGNTNTLNVIPIGDDPKVKAAHVETYRNTAMAMTWDKVTENATNKKCDKENQRTMTLHVQATKGAASKSNVSDILLHHLSKEQLLRAQGINFETLPEARNGDCFDEAAFIKNIISRYVKNSFLKAQTSEFIDQFNPKRDVKKSSKPTSSPIMTKENICDLEKPVVTANSNHHENLNFLTKIKGPQDEQKSCQRQTPQKQLTEKATSSNDFKYGKGQVHCQLPDFSKVALKMKIPKNHIMNKSLTMIKPASFSPKLRNKSAIMQDILETMFRSKYVEKQHPEQKRESTKPSQQMQMEPTVHKHQDFLTEIKTETHLLKLSSASQKEPFSSTYIFQKLSQGKQMCQKLKEQTDQLKTKVQEFSKKIKQEPFCHLKEKRMVLKKLQEHLEVLEQELLAAKEKHLGLQQHHKHECPTVDDFDPNRKVEDKIFKLEVLLEDVREKIDESKCTSALCLPVSSPIFLDDLASTASLSSNEEDPSSTRGRQKRAEMMTSSPSCAFCSRLLEWKQNMEKKGHRQIDCGRLSVVLHEKALRQRSTLGSDTEPRFCSGSDTGWQRSKCEDCGNNIRNYGKVCSKEPLNEFYYRYNTPGQNYLNHSRKGAFVQSSDENKNSSPLCPKPKRICSQRVNSKSFQGEHEPTPGKKKNLKTFMTYSSVAIPLLLFHSFRIPGSKSLCGFSGSEETESKILNSALDHALKTATILKKTTDQMIKGIAEDLAKAERWRNQLKYY
ncbi:LOW QUALITY PROTEIN: protein AKNAD1 [Callospermophilus lateralis]